jgi:hypothetical protein
MKIAWGRSIGWNLDIRKMEYSIIEDGAGCYPWREVFALWPVKTINGKYIWWKRVFKRKVWVVWGTGFHMEPETQYATAFDLLECYNGLE